MAKHDKRMTQALVIEATRHEALEEMFFWPAVREHHPDGDALADEAIADEQWARHVLTELDRLEADDARFEALLGTFAQAAREHIEFEESQVWPGLHAVLPAETAEELGRKITSGKKIAPTRPYSHMPPAPGVLKATGPTVTAADQARDAVTGRRPG
jgi:Hemerythrin HHE cation binding domain